jgi:hypothetical protein
MVACERKTSVRVRAPAPAPTPHVPPPFFLPLTHFFLFFCIYSRAHRFGQEKPVYVKRVMLIDTVEQRICNLQKNKQDITDSTLGEGTGKSQSCLLLALFFFVVVVQFLIFFFGGVL